MRYRSKKILVAARGQDCTVNLPCCNHNPETTVAAHINMLGRGCMGGKTHDLHIAFACSSCHDEIDGRTRNYDRPTVRVYSLEAVLKTQDLIIEMGLLA